MRLSFPMIFWCGKCLCFKAGSHICQLEKTGGKERDPNQKFQPSDDKTSIEQNLASQKAEKCAKCHKVKLLLKVWSSPSTWGQRDSEWTAVGKVVTLEPVQGIGRRHFLEKNNWGKRGPRLDKSAERRWQKGKGAICSLAWKPWRGCSVQGTSTVTQNHF